MLKNQSLSLFALVVYIYLLTTSPLPPWTRVREKVNQKCCWSSWFLCYLLPPRTRLESFLCRGSMGQPGILLYEECICMLRLAPRPSPPALWGSSPPTPRSPHESLECVAVRRKTRGASVSCRNFFSLVWHVHDLTFLLLESQHLVMTAGDGREVTSSQVKNVSLRRESLCFEGEIFAPLDEAGAMYDSQKADASSGSAGDYLPTLSRPRSPPCACVKCM